MRSGAQSTSKVMAIIAAGVSGGGPGAYANSPQVVCHRVIARVQNFVVHREQEHALEVLLQQAAQRAIVLQVDMPLAGILRGVLLGGLVRRADDRDAHRYEACREMAHER